MYQVRHAAGEDRGQHWSIDAIEFTDGTVLRLLVLEGDYEYGIEGIYPGHGIGEERVYP